MVMGSYIDQKNAMELAIASGKAVFTGPQAAAFNTMRMNGSLPSLAVPAADGVRALPPTFPPHVRDTLPSLCFCNMLGMCVRLPYLAHRLQPTAALQALCSIQCKTLLTTATLPLLLPPFARFIFKPLQQQSTTCRVWYRGQSRHLVSSLR